MDFELFFITTSLAALVGAAVALLVVAVCWEPDHKAVQKALKMIRREINSGITQLQVSLMVELIKNARKSDQRALDISKSLANHTKQIAQMICQEKASRDDDGWVKSDTSINGKVECLRYHVATLVDYMSTTKNCVREIDANITNLSNSMDVRGSLHEIKQHMAENKKQWAGWVASQANTGQSITNLTGRLMACEDRSCPSKDIIIPYLQQCPEILMKISEMNNKLSSFHGRMALTEDKMSGLEELPRIRFSLDDVVRIADENHHLIAKFMRKHAKTQSEDDGILVERLDH